MKETSKRLEIKAKTMWSGQGQSGQAGPEILGVIDGLINIFIVGGLKFYFYNFGGLFMYNFFKIFGSLRRIFYPVGP